LYYCRPGKDRKKKDIVVLASILAYNRNKK